MLEKSVVGQKLKLLNINGINSAKETDANNENLDEDIVEEDYCEPVSMQERQDRCMVSFSVTSVHTVSFDWFLSSL